ncbi:MAG: carboxypeptidase regulatory-like domain-containing protein [Myxococcales bacterium]
MARQGLFAAVVLGAAACGNGVVIVAGATGRPPGGGGQGGSAGQPISASVSGQVIYGQPAQPLEGATVSLSPPAVAAVTADRSGIFSFGAVPAGTYQITASFPGLPPTAQSISVSSDLQPVTLQLEASIQLMGMPDGGDIVPWISFAPRGGPLFASTWTALWQISDAGAAALWNDGTQIAPLGFGAGGEIIYLSDCAASDAGAEACRLAFGQAPAATTDGGVIEIFDGGPFIVGDRVVYAAAPVTASGWQIWLETSAAHSDHFAPLLAAAMPATDEDRRVLACAMDLSDPPLFSAPVLATISGTTGINLIGNVGGSSLDGGISITPLADDIVAVLTVESQNGILLKAAQPRPIATFSASRMTAGPNGTLLASTVGDGVQWLTEVLPDGGQIGPVSMGTAAWPPVVSPDGTWAAFPSAPYLADFATGSQWALAEVPVFVQFSHDSSSLLLVGGDETLHVIALGDAGLVDRLLEGSATAATFTPDGRLVVYGGVDPLANAGIFEEPACPPSITASSPADAGSPP